MCPLLQDCNHLLRVSKYQGKLPMVRTLKEQYETKQVHRLQERLAPIDRKVMVELKWDARDRLILEAFDKQQMAAAIDIVKKLKTINFGTLQSLAQARDAAITDVTKVLAGDKSQGLIRKIVNLFKSDKENPLVDTLAFAEALHNFFTQFTQYVTALGGGDKDITLGAAVTGQSGEDKEIVDFAAAVKNKNPKANDLQKIIINGFKPEGALANISKNWIDKYMKGKKGLQQLANEMFGMKMGDLQTVSQSVVNGLKNTDAVGQAAAGAAQQAAVSTTGTTGSTVTGSAEAGQGSKGSKTGATAPGTTVAPRATGGNIDKAFADLKDAGVDKEYGVSPAALKAIIAALAEKDYLK